jgi:hypothetical protein
MLRGEILESLPRRVSSRSRASNLHFISITRTGLIRELAGYHGSVTFPAELLHGYGRTSFANNSLQRKESIVNKAASRRRIAKNVSQFCNE